MTSYLLDLFVPRIRKTAVASMIKAYVFLGRITKAVITGENEFHKLNVNVTEWGVLR